ncbi:MAG: hypothetical protein IJ529_05830 [Alphaproteobacteria bacterium]|nr:hypothetical protein [Alphaproteobacteria bacterium]MBQ9235237.1 hypothetical protein [Alphaproteobacteria bacterium]
MTELTIYSLWLTAFLTAVVHTITGPDHYLPFIAIAGARNYSLKKTLLWTFICGLGHIGSALLIALAFVYLAHFLSREQLTFVEENRSNIAAFALIILGGAYLLLALRHKLQHKLKAPHVHHHHDLPRGKNISVWVIFIIFVLGPCEALLPILTAASVLSTKAVISSTIIFSFATISAMMLMVALGLLGLQKLQVHKLENWAHELAGLTILLCGFAILCGL